MKLLKAVELKESGWYWYIPSSDSNEMQCNACPLYFEDDELYDGQNETSKKLYKGNFYPLSSKLFEDDTKAVMDDELLKHAVVFYFGKLQIEGMVLETYIKRENKTEGWVVEGHNISNIITSNGPAKRTFRLRVTKLSEDNFQISFDSNTGTLWQHLHGAVACLMTYIQGGAGLVV